VRTPLTDDSYYKTAFVPQAKRIAAPVTAIDSIKTVFKISDRELIRIAGVDGFLFLQYLQLLLRIFIPMAIVILPILLPINRVGDEPGVSGLDSFAWPNVAFENKRNRLWAHVILAVAVVCWVCFNFFLAMRKFVRLRQTILTMPEHRIRFCDYHSGTEHSTQMAHGCCPRRALRCLSWWYQGDLDQSRLR
jgi:hypothetical protein